MTLFYQFQWLSKKYTVIWEMVKFYMDNSGVQITLMPKTNW